jgi:hypothetical protein
MPVFATKPGYLPVYIPHGMVLVYSFAAGGSSGKAIEMLTSSLLMLA